MASVSYSVQLQQELQEEKKTTTTSNERFNEQQKCERRKKNGRFYWVTELHPPQATNQVWNYCRLLRRYGHCVCVCVSQISNLIWLNLFAFAWITIHITFPLGFNFDDFRLSVCGYCSGRFLSLDFNSLSFSNFECACRFFCFFISESLKCMSDFFFHMILKVSCLEVLL